MNSSLFSSLFSLMYGFLFRTTEKTYRINLFQISLVSTKISYKLFEIIEIQSVISILEVDGFEFTFAVLIRLLCIKTSSFLLN